MRCIHWQRRQRQLVRTLSLAESSARLGGALADARTARQIAAAVRCGQQLVRFWPAANDGGFVDRRA